MKSLLGKSFKILRENMLFIQPILLYLLFFVITIPYIISPHTFIYTKVILSVCLLLFSSAVITGTFYISKKAIDEYNENDTFEEKQTKSIKNIKSFFEGVGKYFFKFVFAFILMAAIYALSLKAINIICTHYFGVPVLLSRLDEFAKLENMEQIKTFIYSLNQNDLYTLEMWILIMMISNIILHFLGFLYCSVLISDKNNFLICLFKTLSFFFKNIFKSVLIILFMLFLYILINVISAPFGGNSIILAILTVFLVMYLNYYIILVLCFYNEKSENNSDSRPECIGENESCN